MMLHLYCRPPFRPRLNRDFTAPQTARRLPESVAKRPISRAPEVSRRPVSRASETTWRRASGEYIALPASLKESYAALVPTPAGPHLISSQRVFLPFSSGIRSSLKTKKAPNFGTLSQPPVGGAVGKSELQNTPVFSGNQAAKSKADAQNSTQLRIQIRTLPTAGHFRKCGSTASPNSRACSVRSSPQISSRM